MPEGTVTEVFRADLDVNLKAKEALAELDQLNSQIKKAVAEMQSSLDSLQFKSPFKTWQSELEIVARELAALTMPRAMRLDLPEREIERYSGRLKEIANEFGLTMEQIRAYLEENAEAFTTLSRAGAEAFVASIQWVSDEVVGGSIIPEMVQAIRAELGGLVSGLGGAMYGPFAAIVEWARNMSTDTKLQFSGMVSGVAEILGEMGTEAKTQAAATAAEAEKVLFGPQQGFQGLMSTLGDVKQAFRLLREEGGNVGIALEILSGAAGDVATRFGSSNEAVQTFLAINNKIRPVLTAVGNAILRLRDAAQGHDAIISRTAKNAGRLTESLQLQAKVWRQQVDPIRAAKAELQDAQKAIEALQRARPATRRRTVEDLNEIAVALKRVKAAEEEVARTEAMGPYFQAVVGRVSVALGKLDTSLKHVSTSFLATGKISKERMQDARRAIDDLATAMENAQKLGIPLDPKFEAKMKEAIDVVRLLAAEEQRLATGVKTRIERQKERAAAIETVNTKTQQMISYLRPGGPMEVGMTSTNMALQDGSVYMQGFSMSIGSVLSVLAGIGGILGELNPAFSAVMIGVAQMADRFVASIAAMMAAAATGRDRIRAAMSALGAILTGFGISALGMIVSTGRLAAEVETLWITLRTTAVNVGMSIPVITEQLEALKESGITTREALKALTQFLRAKLPLDQLDDLAEAAKNVAVTLPQMTSSEVLQRFVWVIQSGNSALLDALGIQKTVNQFVKEYADELGVATSALKDRQKQEAIIAGLLKEVANFQGVYNEAMKTASKQLSSMVRYWEELRLKIGEQFLPIVTKVVFAFAEFLKSLKDMPPETLKLITTIVAAIAIFGTFFGALLLLAPGISALIGLIGGLVGVIGSVISAIGGFLVAAVTSIGGFITLATTVGITIPLIGGFVAVVYKLIKGFKDIETPLEGVEGLLERLKIALRPLINTWRYFWEEVVTIRWIRIKEGIDKIVNRLRGFAAENEGIVALIERAWVVAKDLVWVLIEVIDELLAAFGDLLNYDYEGMWEHFLNAAATALGWVAELFADFILAAYGWGANVAKQMALGLLDAASTAIPTAASYVGEMLSMFLEGHSPALAGPLKRVRIWGRGIGEAFGGGVSDVNIAAHAATLAKQFGVLRIRARVWGRDLTQTFAEGISIRAVEAISPAMNVIGQEIARFLEGGSPPEAGRLAELQNWGKSAMEAFMTGFSMADFGVFDTALSMIETRIKILIGTGKEQAQELAAAMYDMRGRVAEAIATMGAGAAVDISNLANSIFQNVAVPVMDILQVARAQLEATAAKDVVAAIRDAAAAARESRRKQIEAIQDTIYAFQEGVAALNESKEALKAKIEEEVKARLRIMGLVIDPAVMKRLQAELRRASLKVKKQEAELQKFTALRNRLGIDMLSWEEVSLMASLDLAKQKQSEAQIAVDEEQDRIARAKDLQEQIEAQYEAEFEAIENRIKNAQASIKAQQKLLRQAQRADREATKAEQERIRLAQEHAAALAARAALLRKALQERLKAEELYAKMISDAAEEVEEAAKRPPWVPPERPPRRPPIEPVEPEVSDRLREMIDRIREFIAGGPRVWWEALSMAVYEIAKVVLGKFGIDLDEMLRKARLKWEGIKEWFAGVGEKWGKALGKAREILAPLFEAIKTQWDTLKKAVTDPELKKAWEGLKDALGGLWEALGPVLVAIKDLIIQTGSWKSILVLLIPLYVLLRIGIAILTGLITAMTQAIEGAVTTITGMTKALTGTVEIITGILTGDWSMVGEGLRTVFEANVEVLLSFISTAYEVFGGFVAGVLEAVGLGGIVDAFVEFKNRVIEQVQLLVNDIGQWFVNLYERLIGESIVWDIVNGIIGAFQGLVDRAIAWGLQLVNDFVAGITEAWFSLDTKILEIVNKLGEVGFYILMNVWAWGMNLISEFVRGITETWFSIEFKVLEIMNKIGEIGIYIITYAMGWGSSLLSKIQEGITVVWEAFSAKILAIKVKVGEIGAYILEKALGWGSDLLNKFRAGIVAVWVVLTTQIDEIVNKLGDINIGEQALEWGRNLIDSFAEGVRDRYFGNLMPLIREIADWIWRRLGFGSVPEEGPLSTTGEWGPEMMRVLAGGIRANSGLVFAEIAALASGLSAGLNVGITPPGMTLAPVTISYAPVLHFHGPVSPEEVKKAVIEAPSEIDWEAMTRR